ncbi:hypothetical protein HN371_12285 [Candidatus Poribacteria bacterium]|nr:hypothetical protein [Candidatus Poribacteria bacterium]MBT5709833.1 hypothetical protein [Candidatus Poribacteria bacterium]MBT7099045.1 hypothetical protein [Candidatus Poribacteria bacterium]MBT7806026.1 hypothetical protein [Candidatus Poribacteria bacterium]
MTPATAALRAMAAARSRMAYNAIARASPARHATRVVFGAVIAAYIVQATSAATALFADPTTAADLACAMFAAVWAFALMRAVACSLQWVTGEPDLRLLGALPVRRPLLFAAQYGAVVWDVVRVQVLSAPLIAGYAVASGAPAPRIAAYATAWAFTMLAAAAVGVFSAVFVARCLHPERAQAAFRVISMLCIVAVFATLMRVADVGGGWRPTPGWDATAYLAWAPTSWVVALLGEGGWPHAGGVALVTAAAVVAAAGVFSRWFDLEAAVGGGYASDRLARGGRGALTRPRRSVFTATVIKELRSSLRSTTTVARWLGPIALTLVFVRLAGGPDSSHAEVAALLHVVALVASLVVSHSLAVDETGAGWVIRVNARRGQMVTAAKASVVAAITGVSALVAVGLCEGLAGLTQRLDEVGIVAVSYAAFGLAIERATLRPGQGAKPRGPGLIGVFGRQLFLAVGVTTAVVAEMTVPALSLVPVVVAGGFVVAVERAVPSDRRLW